MKRAIVILLTALLLLSLCACGSPEPEPTPDIRPTPPLPVISQEPVETPAPTPESAPEPTARPTMPPVPFASAEPGVEDRTPVDDPELASALEAYFSDPVCASLLHSKYIANAAEGSLAVILSAMRDPAYSAEEARDLYTAQYGMLGTALSWAGCDWFSDTVWELTGCELESFPDFEELTYDEVDGVYFGAPDEEPPQQMEITALYRRFDGYLLVYYRSADGEGWRYRDADGNLCLAGTMLLWVSDKTSFQSTPYLPIRNYMVTPPEPEDPDAELISDIEWYFNQMGMNGLLQTAYDDITGLYLREILYQLQDDEVSHEEAREAYAAAFEEPFTDLSYMQDWSFENYVWYITGHALDEFPDYEDLPYDPVSGLYFDQHGDTNYQLMKVLSVEHGEGSILYVHYCAGWEWDNRWFFRTADEHGLASDMLLTLTTETNLPCQFLPISNTPCVLEDW